MAQLVLPRDGDDGMADLRAAAPRLYYAAARDLAEQAASENPQGAATVAITRLSHLLENFPDPAVADAFTSPFAAFDTANNASALERIVDDRTRSQRALSTWRLVIGVPHDLPLHVVLPPEAFPQGALLLPHLGVTVQNFGGPIAVRQESDTVQLTWDDGHQLTLPISGTPAWPETPVPGVLPVPVVDGVPVLSTVAPDVAGVFHEFEIADISSLGQSMALAHHAHALLAHVWPAAHTMSARTLTGYVMLRPRPWTRSHTSPVLPGTVLISAGDQVSFADLLCHELAHARIGAVMAVDPLLATDTHTHTSPWREDPRPLLGVLLGVHAFVNVCVFYLRLIHVMGADPRSERVYATQIDNVRRGLALLEQHADPTPIGAAVIAALSQEVNQLP